MAKQVINVGTAANDKKGDSLRAAFQKVNTNFTELYTALGINADVDLNLGAFEFTGSVMTTTDSSAIVIDQATTITSNLSVGGDILPQTAHGGDLGSSTLPWRSLYVSNNTIYIGGTAVGVDANGALTTGGTVVGSTPAWASITGKPTFATVATTGVYADLTGKPTIPTLVSQLSNDSGFLTSVSNIQSESDVSIQVNLTDSTTRIWRFGEDGDLTFPDGTAQTTAYTGGGGGSGSTLVNGAYTVSLGSTGVLTFPNGLLKIAGNKIRNVNESVGLILGSEIEVTVDKTVISNGLTDADVLSNQHIFEVGSTRILSAYQVVNSLGGPSLTGQQLTELTSTGFQIGYRVINDPGEGEPLTSFSGWTFGTVGQSQAITFPDGTIQTTAPESFSFSVAADDSTQRAVSNNELVKFIGAGGVTTASDAEGNITINYVQGDIRSDSNINIDINLSDSTLRRWQFGEDGSLTLPSVGKINNGEYDWTFGSTGNTTFPTGLTLAAARGPNTVNFTSGIDKEFQIETQTNTTGRLWNFSTDGSLTIPGDIKSNSNINIDINLIDSTLRRWQFGEDGHLTLPVGGDIKDSTGTSVLGGSVSSLVNSTKTLSLGNDGSLTSNGALTLKTPNGIPSSVSNWVGGGGWNNPPYSNLATTGGTGTGLTVNVSAADGGYININYITIATAGTGYTAGDVITITNENSLSGTFTIGVAGTRDWQFGIDGGLTLPLNGIIQSVQSGNYQSKVTVSPLQILSQARTSQAQSYTVAGEAFTSASGDGAGLITFVNPSGSMTEFLIDTMQNGGVYERTVRINGAGPEYQYNYFNGADSIVLVTYPAAGAVTDIRFSYTRISKIDISPDEGVFNIQSESGQDIDIQSGSDLDIVANEKVYMISGTNMRLQAGNGNVQISTNYAVPNATQRDWIFDINGQLTLPNNAVLRNTVNGAIAFGIGAGHQPQGATAISIGNDAGYYTQGADAVAIGRSAGENYQGANAIAIGLFAGQTDQAANSIVLNATGVALEQTTANTFTVAPIRNISATSGVLQYNSSTKEVSYSLNVTAETFNTDQITLVGNRISTTVTNANLELECNGTGGVVINTVAEATTASTARSVGYLGIPASAVTTTATLTIADAGEHIYLTSTGQTITIPANASVAYPIGTTLTFIAGPSATTTTIAITSDTMYLAGTGTTGSRTLAAHGMATAVKVAATTWYINGTGLT